VEGHRTGKYLAREEAVRTAERSEVRTNIVNRLTMVQMTEGQIFFSTARPN